MGEQPLPGKSVSEAPKTRRTIFVFGSTALFTGLISLLNYVNASGPIAERTVDGSFGIIELLVIGYLFSATLDKSRILDNIGKGVREYADTRRTVLTSGRDPSESEEDKTYG